MACAFTGFIASAQDNLAATASHQAIFSEGGKVSESNFTRVALLHPLTDPNTIFNVLIASFTCERGVRTHWHTHASGQ